MKIRIQIVLALLILFKVVLGSVFVCRIGPGSLSDGVEAVASELPQNPDPAEDGNKKVDTQEETDLNLLIMKKVKAREKIISERKAELLAIQADINNKICAMKRDHDDKDNITIFYEMSSVLFHSQ